MSFDFDLKFENPQSFDINEKSIYVENLNIQSSACQMSKNRRIDFLFTKSNL